MFSCASVDPYQLSQCAMQWSCKLAHHHTKQLPTDGTLARTMDRRGSSRHLHRTPSSCYIHLPTMGSSDVTRQQTHHRVILRSTSSNHRAHHPPSLLPLQSPIQLQLHIPSNPINNLHPSRNVLRHRGSHNPLPQTLHERHVDQLRRPRRRHPQQNGHLRPIQCSTIHTTRQQRRWSKPLQPSENEIKRNEQSGHDINDSIRRCIRRHQRYARHQ